MALHFHKLTVRDIRKETNDCVSVAFDIPKELANIFNFKQGQNITIKHVIDNEEIRRSYSICSSPFDNELRVAIKKVFNGIFSSFANNTLRKEDIMEVLPPSGSFSVALNNFNKKSYVFFAAGSGITPIISIIKTILLSEPGSSVTLIYGNKNVSSIIFKEDIEALKDRHIQRFRVYYILSREITNAAINYGRIDNEKCKQLSRLIDFVSVDEFFICGPEQMILIVKDFLENKNIAINKIHFELFTTPKRKNGTISNSIKPVEKGSEVTIKFDGRSINFNLDYNSNNILDAALARGVDLPFACKGGVCCTCKARLVEGEVEMEVNYGLEPDEINDGYILTCQSHPRSTIVVIDYDVK